MFLMIDVLGDYPGEFDIVEVLKCFELIGVHLQRYGE